MNKTLTLIVLIFSTMAFADCISKDQAADKAAQLFIDEYVEASTKPTFSEEFWTHFNEAAFPETKEGARQALFTENYEFDKKSMEHRFSTVVDGSELHSTTGVIGVNCTGNIRTWTWSEND